MHLGVQQPVLHIVDKMVQLRHQHFEDYYFNNLSLGEISENENVSRNAIHKSIKSIENKLYFYEEKLKLYQKSQELNTLLANIKDEKLKKDIKNIL